MVMGLYLLLTLPWVPFIFPDEQSDIGTYTHFLFFSIGILLGSRFNIGNQERFNKYVNLYLKNKRLRHTLIFMPYFLMGNFILACTLLAILINLDNPIRLLQLSGLIGPSWACLYLISRRLDNYLKEEINLSE